MEIVKTLTKIASEFTMTPKTLRNHINKEPILREEIKTGLQTPRKQKMIYDVLGYPTGVDKKDYENV